LDGGNLKGYVNASRSEEMTLNWAEWKKRTHALGP